jgi:cystathionine beta-lyase family protein involved in aluminum resistance
LRAFYDEGVVESDLPGTLGYGYDDQARARYESLLARIFGVERVLARFSFVSGTHAIVAALSAWLERGGRLVAAAGRPYDTLRNALVDAPDSLVSRGIAYDEIALDARGDVDFAALAVRAVSTWCSCSARAATRRVPRCRPLAAARSRAS